MKYDADALALNELKWKAELAEAIIIPLMNSSSTKSVLDGVIQFEIDEEQEPYSWEDTTNFANVSLAKAKQRVTTQNHEQSLGSNPLNNNELSDGPEHSD